MKYLVVERYADNGGLSHYDLINTENGETAITDIEETLQFRKADVSGSLNNKLKIEFKQWNYECADGCCTHFGCDIFLNDEKLEEQHADDHVNALNAILPKLGYEVEIINN
jgi:hypothetical protein